MKLRNKLIPIIGTLATTTAVVPLSITSCKLSKEYNTVELSDGYTPTVAPIETTLDYNQDSANKLYLAAIKEDSNIFHDDLVYGTYSRYVKNQSTSYHVNSLKIGNTTPTFGTAYIIYPSEGEFKYPTITCSTTMSWSYDEAYQDGGNQIVRTTTKNITADFENIPFYGSYDFYTGNWTFGVRQSFDRAYNYIFQYYTGDYSLTYNYSETAYTKVYKSSGEVTESTTTKTDSNTIDTYKKVVAFQNSPAFNDVLFQYSSNYLQYVSPFPEVTFTQSAYLYAKTGATVIAGDRFLSFSCNFQNYDEVPTIEFVEPLKLKETTEGEETLQTITLTALKPTRNADFGGVCYVEGTISGAKTPTETPAYYTFSIPKYFKVKITVLIEAVSKSWEQTVYTNINTLKLQVE